MSQSGQPAYQHNGHAVSAEAFYAIACDPRRSVAVQACAGAGKTWMLVSRILRALLEGGDTLQPQDILAITFTKKAAGEMRERLNDWLTAFSNLPDDALMRELHLRGFDEKTSHLGKQEATSLLRNLKQKVLQLGRPVQIRTFHSWFAALLKTAPLALLQSLGLPSVYELLEDDAQAKEEVWPRFFALVAQSPDLRADFEQSVAIHGRFQTLKALDVALDKRVEFTLADAHGVLATSVRSFQSVFDDLAALAAPDEALAPGGPYRRDFDAAAVALGQASAATFSAKGAELEIALTAGDVEGALAALLTKGEPRKFSEKVPQIAQVRVAQALAVRLLAARNQHQACLHQARMSRLTRELISAFAKLKHERGWVDMNDVERAAQAMLGHAELSGWLQQRLDARVRHLMIDEFQDTSPLQWQALSAWLSAYAGSGSGEAPKVFIVGDPKQSIYRFRRAEPQVFLAAQAFVHQGLGGDLLSCDHTRRNASAVVEAVNSAMLAAQSAGEYADYRTHTTASEDAGAVWSLPPIAVDAAKSDDADTLPSDVWRDSLTTPREEPEETRRSLECRQAAHWLAGLLQRDAQYSALLADGQGLRPQHLMVLSRRRQRLSLMQDELRRLHIPALQPEKNGLGDAPEVKDLMALLDVLLSPQNDLALAQALKSPLFGCTDDDLIGLAVMKRREPAPWTQLLPQATHGQADWPVVAATLQRWAAWLAAVPPHDALHLIYEDGDVVARFASAAPQAARGRVIANLKALLAAALDFDGGRYATPYALVRALKAGRIKAPTTAHPDAVQLLTVHGAKGLEAPLVMLLDTDGSPPKAETMGVLVDWPGEAAAPTRFSFLASETRPPPCNVDAVAAEKAARQREELNGLYVAMTRARHTFVVSSNTPSRRDSNSWWNRLLALSTPVELPDDDADVAGTGVLPARAAAHEPWFSVPELPFRQSGIGLFAIKNEASFAPSQTAMTMVVDEAAAKDKAGVDAEASVSSRIGQAMHRLLEWLPLGKAWGQPSAPATGTPGATNAPHSWWSEEQVTTAAMAFELSESQVQHAVAMARAIREGEGAWAWDDTLVVWAANEVPLTVQGKLLYVDRLVQRRDTADWWVLDYKSASAPLRQVALQTQLRTYRDAIAKTLPGHAVKAAFLTAPGRVVELP